MQTFLSFNKPLLLIQINKIFHIGSELVRMSIDSVKNEPLSRTFLRIKSYFFEPHRFKLLIPVQKNTYEHFLSNQLAQAKHDLLIDKVMDSFTYTPIISIVIPVYNTPVKWLDPCIRSVLDQWYDQFELIIYDDGSSNEETQKALDKIKSLDPKIKLIKGEERLQISMATNQALSHVTGEFVAFMDHDDTIEPFALMEIVKTINSDPNVDVIYSDEDKLDPKGMRFGPYFKSDFDEDLLISNNYISHLCVVRKAVGDKIGWLKEGMDGAQDHDLLLRLIDVTKNILHIPKVLYSWRQYPGSTALSHDEKPYALEAGKKAVREYTQRHSIDAEVSDGPWKGAYRLKRRLTHEPLVSIIIPFKDQSAFLEQCIQSILEKTSYTNFELLLVNNNSELPETNSLIEKFASKKEIRLLNYSKEFNFSDINNFACEHALGEHVLFLNNDTAVINADWLTEMASQIERKNVGVVGANLRYADDTVQHQGVVLGIGGFAGHIFRHFPADDCRHFSQGLVRQYSAVTGACLLTRKQLFLSVGGFDSENLKIALNDVDFCLKIREKGYKVIYTPYAQLYHYESKSRGYEDTPEKKARLQNEGKYLLNKWRSLIQFDPFYNPNLTLDREDVSLR